MKRPKKKKKPVAPTVQEITDVLRDALHAVEDARETISELWYP